MATARAPMYACPDCAGGDRVHPLRRAHRREAAAAGTASAPTGSEPADRCPPMAIAPPFETRRLPAETWNISGGERWIACFIWGLWTTLLGALSLFLIYLLGAAGTIGLPFLAVWLLLGVVPLVVGAWRVLDGHHVAAPRPARPRTRTFRLLYCERCDAVFLPYQASLVETPDVVAPASRPETGPRKPLPRRRERGVRTGPRRAGAR